MIDIEKANTLCVERMMESQPIVTGVARAIDVIPGMRDNLFLHAGPPITWERRRKASCMWITRARSSTAWKREDDFGGP